MTVKLDDSHHDGVISLLSFVDECLQEKSSVRALMVEEGQMARRDLQYRLKLAEDQQIEWLKAVIFVCAWYFSFELTKCICCRCS